MAVLANCWYARGAQLPLRHYTTADGLANNAILSIASDSRGFLWFATMEGLSRFDGSGFANQTESTGLPHGFISQVLIGRHGNYWLATRAGLVRFRPDLPQSNADRMLVIRPNANPTAHITALLEDRDGTLWCGTESGLYAIHDTASRIPRLVEIEIGLPGISWGDSDVTALAQHAEDGVWIGLANGTLYRLLENRRVERYPSPEPAVQGQITHLLGDRKDRIWVGRGDSLYRSIPASRPGANGFESLSGQKGVPPRTRVFDIFESRKGDVWVGMYRYLAQFPEDGTAVRLWSKDNGLPSRGVGSLAEDRDGNLWMGTADQGVLKLATGGILTYSTTDGLGGDAIISIAETMRGDLYVAGRRESHGFRIATASGATSSGNAFHAIAPRTARTVWDFGWRVARVVLQDHAGEWWLASAQGLVRYPDLEGASQLAVTTPKAVYSRADGLPGNVVVRLYEDAEGNIWAGCEATTFAYWSRSAQRFIDVSAAEARAWLRHSARTIPETFGLAMN